MILLDSFHRTAKGFAILIEKEFLSFGHQFGTRSGIIPKKEDSDQASPVFIQFLDCVYQLTIQFPEAFEFNESFLLFLAEKYHSLLYGTFLYNSEYHRKENKAKQKTKSIWSDLFYIKYNDEESNQFDYVTLKQQYQNSLYNENKFQNSELYPNHGLHCLVVWENYFYPTGNLLEKITTGVFFDEFNLSSSELNTHPFFKYNNKNKNMVILEEAYSNQLNYLMKSIKYENDKFEESSTFIEKKENRFHSDFKDDDEKEEKNEDTEKREEEENYDHENVEVLDDENVHLEENTLQIDQEDPNALDTANEDEINSLREDKAKLEEELSSEKTKISEMRLLISLLGKKIDISEQSNDNLSEEDKMILDLKEKYSLKESEL